MRRVKFVAVTPNSGSASETFTGLGRLHTLQKQKRDYHSPERVIVALDIALAITSDSHPSLPRVIFTP